MARARINVRVCAVAACLIVHSASYASHFRYGHITWQSVPGMTNTAEFSATIGVRRTGYAGPGPFTGGDGLPDVGDIIIERQGPSIFDFGDLTPGGPMAMRVTAIDPAQDWMIGQALQFAANPGTGVTVAEVEPNGLFIEAILMDVGDDFAGTIASSSDVDTAAFFGVAGQRIRVQFVSGSLSLPIVQVYRDVGGGLGVYLMDWFNEISLVLPDDGLYYLVVFGGSASTGTYVVELRDGDFVDNIVHTYAAPTLGGTQPWLAGVDTCCRILGLRNGSESSYRVQTAVRFDIANASPVSSLAPIINVPRDTLHSFQVPAIDPDGDALHWRFATNAEAGGGSYTSIGPPNAAHAPNVDNNTGIVEWDTAGTTAGHLYTMQVVIEDRDSATGASRGRSAVDFIIRIVDPAGNDAPLCEIDPPGPFDIEVGEFLSFTVTGTDPNPGDLLTLNSAGFPAGASFTPVLPVVDFDTVSSTFAWTPAPGQVGAYSISFTITDQGGLQTLCSVQITVREPVNNDPPTCGIDPAGPLNVQVGDLVSFTVTGTDPNAGDLLTLDASGAPAGSSFDPALPAAGIGTVSSDFSWTPAPGDEGSYAITFTLTDPAGLASECSIEIQVRTPPPPGTCVRSQGYWKNYPEAWPVDSLLLGNVEYTRDQLLRILNQSPARNGLPILAHQLVAAKLNVAAGAALPPAADAAIAEADALIGNLVIPPIGTGHLPPADVSGLAGVLDAYCNGALPDGPPHCGDER